MKKSIIRSLQFILYALFLTGIFSTAFAGECSDSIDNDGDGLVDWIYDQGCYGPDDPTEGGLSTGEQDNGWTVFEPSADSRIVYVSSSEGDDSSDGLSSTEAKKTISAAYALTRPDYPDWILLKRGDTWYERLQLRNGRSKTEPFLVSSYGPSTQRPLLKTGAAGISVNKYFQYIGIVGIHFYAHTRDFNSDEFTSQDGQSGFNFNAADTGTGLLIEDCCFRFYQGNVIQGQGTLYDIFLRRNLILDNYSHDSHSQGMYCKNTSLLLEENIFDHNGWFKQQVDGGNEQDSGQATMFNHNTYFSSCHGVTFRGNIFMQPSSMNNKWTANYGEASAWDIKIDNNLYIDGEIGIGIGGNETEPPYRFKNVAITNNVITDIGLSRPTNRTLGWMLEMNDWDIGTVINNLFMHQASSEVNNVFAIRLDGESREVTIKENIAHGIISNQELMILYDGTTKQNISITDNKLQCPDQQTVLVEARGSLENYSFAGNTYFSKHPQDEWFSVGGSNVDLAGWQSASGETGAVAQEVTFTDPTRCIEKYHESLGKEATITAFIAEARKQSKFNWRKEYTAAVVNDWLRAGFDMITSAKTTHHGKKTVAHNTLKVFHNPFSSSVEIWFQNPKHDARMDIYMINGKNVAQFYNVKNNFMRWDCSKYSGGIYLVTVKVNGSILREKIVLVN